MAKRYWLMKSEPETFGIEDLARSPRQTTCWDGIRNYQARNLLRDELRVGDGVLFYHSSTRIPAVVGRASVVRAAYPDPTQFDPNEKYHDPKSGKDDPRWYAVDVKLDEVFGRAVSLAELRETPGLEEMALLRRGQRLSVQPVSSAEWKIIRKLTRSGVTGK